MGKDGRRVDHRRCVKGEVYLVLYKGKIMGHVDGSKELHSVPVDAPSSHAIAQVHLDEGTSAPLQGPANP